MKEPLCPQVPRFSTSLSMGDVESALFSDAVINFIYHKLEERGVFNNFKFAESYRDDGIVISNHLMNLEEVNQWKLLRGLPGKRKNRLFLALSPFLGRKICQDGQKNFFFEKKSFFDVPPKISIFSFFGSKMPNFDNFSLFS